MLIGIFIGILISGVAYYIFHETYPKYIEYNTGVEYLYQGLGKVPSGQSYYVLRSTETGNYKLISPNFFKDCFKQE